MLGGARIKVLEDVVEGASENAHLVPRDQPSSGDR